jgi:hypothetical protein
MNGLTAANVDGLIDAIQKTHANCLALEKREAARALADVLFVIKQLREENTTHPSRPDRVGDECWYGTWERGIGWQWRRGILRAWVPGDCPAVVEDAEAKKVECYSMISFSNEAPA